MATEKITGKNQQPGDAAEWAKLGGDEAQEQETGAEASRELNQKLGAVALRQMIADIDEKIKNTQEQREGLQKKLERAQEQRKSLAGTKRKKKHDQAKRLDRDISGREDSLKKVDASLEKLQAKKAKLTEQLAQETGGDAAGAQAKATRAAFQEITVVQPTAETYSGDAAEVPAAIATATDRTGGAAFSQKTQERLAAAGVTEDPREAEAGERIEAARQAGANAMLKEIANILRGRSPEKALEDIIRDEAKLTLDLDRLQGTTYDDEDMQARHEQRIAEMREDLEGLQRKEAIVRDLQNAIAAEDGSTERAEVPRATVVETAAVAAPAPAAAIDMAEPMAGAAVVGAAVASAAAEVAPAAAEEAVVTGSAEVAAPAAEVAVETAILTPEEMTAAGVSVERGGWLAVEGSNLPQDVIDRIMARRQALDPTTVGAATVAAIQQEDLSDVKQALARMGAAVPAADAAEEIVAAAEGAGDAAKVEAAMEAAKDDEATRAELTKEIKEQIRKQRKGRRFIGFLLKVIPALGTLFALAGCSNGNEPYQPSEEQRMTDGEEDTSQYVDLNPEDGATQTEQGQTVAEDLRNEWANGSRYDFSSFDSIEKLGRHAFGVDYGDDYGDIQATTRDFSQENYNNPHTLAVDTSPYHDLLEECGVGGLSIEEIEDRIINGADGKELQEKLIAGLESRLNSGDAKFEFYEEYGGEESYYMVNTRQEAEINKRVAQAREQYGGNVPNEVILQIIQDVQTEMPTTPSDITVRKSWINRNGEKQVRIGLPVYDKDGNVTGYEWGDFNMACGFQLNVNEQQPTVPVATTTTKERVTVTVTETQPETVTVTETTPETVTVTETVPETVTVTETVPETVTVTETVPETVTVTETHPETVTVTETVPETVTVTETNKETVTVTVTETTPETVTVTETNKETVTVTVTETAPETVTVTVTETTPETVTVTETNKETVTVTVTETVPETVTVTETVPETVTVTTSETEPLTKNPTNLINNGTEGTEGGSFFTTNIEEETNNPTTMEPETSTETRTEEIIEGMTGSETQMEQQEINNREEITEKISQESAPEMFEEILNAGTGMGTGTGTGTEGAGEFQSQQP